MSTILEKADEALKESKETFTKIEDSKKELQSKTIDDLQKVNEDLSSKIVNLDTKIQSLSFNRNFKENFTPCNFKETNKDSINYLFEQYKKNEKYMFTYQSNINELGGYLKPENTLNNLVIGASFKNTPLLNLITRQTVAGDTVSFLRESYIPKIVSLTENSENNYENDATLKKTTLNMGKVATRAVITLEAELFNQSMTYRKDDGTIIMLSPFERMTFLSETSFEREMARQIINGEGNDNDELVGILNDPLLDNDEHTIESGTSQKLAFDDLYTLWSAVSTKYDNNLAWVMSKKTFAKIASFKDTANRPFIVDISGGLTRTILGIPVVLSDDMPDIGSGKKCIILADFSEYFVYENAFRNVMRYQKPMNAITEYFWYRFWTGTIISKDSFRILKIKS